MEARGRLKRNVMDGLRVESRKRGAGMRKKIDE
jgi:hypothetical protein